MLCNFSYVLLRYSPQVQIHFWQLYLYILALDSKACCNGTIFIRAGAGCRAPVGAALKCCVGSRAGIVVRVLRPRSS